MDGPGDGRRSITYACVTFLQTSFSRYQYRRGHGTTVAEPAEGPPRTSRSGRGAHTLQLVTSYRILICNAMPWSLCPGS